MTREEDLIRIGKNLDKMVSRNTMDGALDLLKELKNFNMTLKLLQETRIGMSVNSIRKHCTDEEAIALAKTLIKDWKRLLEAENNGRSQEGINGLVQEREESPSRSHSRKSVLDSSILYPSRYPSPPRPARAPLPVKAIKRPSQDSKKARKESKEWQKHSHSEVFKPTSPTIKRPSLEIKRKLPVDPNAPIAPLPLHLHPPARKENPDPNAPLGPLPFHLHPPPAPKRPIAEGKKDRKESTEGKVSKKHSEAKKDRRGSVEKKSSHSQKRPSIDSKADRRESAGSKAQSAAPHRKPSTDSTDRRESAGFKAQSAAPHRKPSTDSTDRKSKGDFPKTPTTPTSPLSPGFGASGGPLSPQHSTGDSVRDKCIGMIAVALRTDNDYIKFGVNCDRTAVEIEDHIYQEIKATDMKYKNRVRSRISNLKDPKNPGLRKNVLAGNIELSRFASMSAEEMASDELKQLRNVLTQEAIREHQMAKTGGTSTDLLQCDKCKKKNCTYNQVQTRSADEPMTTFVLCNECGNRWKFC